MKFEARGGSAPRPDFADGAPASLSRGKPLARAEFSVRVLGSLIFRATERGDYHEQDLDFGGSGGGHGERQRSVGHWPDRTGGPADAIGARPERRCRIEWRRNIGWRHIGWRDQRSRGSARSGSASCSGGNAARTCGNADSRGVLRQPSSPRRRRRSGGCRGLRRGMLQQQHNQHLDPLSGRLPASATGSLFHQRLLAPSDRFA